MVVHQPTRDRSPDRDLRCPVDGPVEAGREQEQAALGVLRAAQLEPAVRDDPVGERARRVVGDRVGHVGGDLHEFTAGGRLDEPQVRRGPRVVRQHRRERREHPAWERRCQYAGEIGPWPEHHHGLELAGLARLRREHRMQRRQHPGTGTLVLELERGV